VPVQEAVSRKRASSNQSTSTSDESSILVDIFRTLDTINLESSTGHDGCAGRDSEGETTGHNDRASCPRRRKPRTRSGGCDVATTLEGDVGGDGKDSSMGKRQVKDSGTGDGEINRLGVEQLQLAVCGQGGVADVVKVAEGLLVGEEGAVGTGDSNATRDGRASCSVHDIGFKCKAARGGQRTVTRPAATV
jgi:hypothetical protein